MQRAQTEAVRAGVLRFIERIYDPKNPTPLIYPPLPTYRGTGFKVVEVRYRIEKRNLYEEKEVEKLMPVKDEYGTVTGYAVQKVKVRVSDKIVGTEDVEVLDPEGPIVRQIRSGTGDHSRQLLSRGWYGLNGQGLYVLCQVGLGDSDVVKNMTRELERMLREYEMPDTTWDLCWLAMGFMAASDQDQELTPRIAKLLERIVDGAVSNGDKRNPALGLWGPICINHQVLARYFQLEIELRAMLDAADAAAAAAPQAQKPAKFKECQQIAKALADVSAAFKRITQQGRRLSEIERPFSINEDVVTAGLSTYIYNREVADIDSTAVVGMALREARRRKILPEATSRDEVLGRKVLKSGVESQDALQAALKAVLGLAHKDGSFDTGAYLSPVRAYDGIPNLIGVPLAKPLPALLHPETWRSNVSAAAAIHALSGTLETRTLAQARGRGDEEAITKNGQRVADIVRAYIALDPGAVGTRRPHSDETDSLEALEKTRGWPVPTEWKAQAIDVLPIGYQGSPRELLEPLWILHQGADDAATVAAAREIAYRLIIEQGVGGEWAPLSPARNGPMGVSSGEWAHLIAKLAQYHLWQAQEDRRQTAKDPITAPFLRQGPWTFRHPRGIGKVEVLANVICWEEGGPPPDTRWPSSQYESVSLNVAESLAAVLYLTGTLTTPAAITAEEILDIKARSEIAKADYQEALKKLQEAGLAADELAVKTAELEKAGPAWVPTPKVPVTALYPLWNSILLALGSETRLKIPEPAAPAAPAAPPDGTTPGPPVPEAPAEPAVPAGKSLEDLLPAEPEK